MAGPWAIVSYLMAGVVMLLSALCFVVVATRAKSGDTGYGPIADLLGPGWRFLSMWSFYLNGLFIVAFLAVSFGEYLQEYFVESVSALTAAAIALVAVAALNLGPSSLVARTETVVVAVKVALLLLFIGWGLASIGDIDGSIYSTSGNSVFGAAALLFTAYTGFNVVTNMAGSLRNPRRDVPLAVIGSIAISAVIYVGVIVAMLASALPHFGAVGVGEAAEEIMGSWGAELVALAACLSTLSGANANLLGASELSVRMAAQNDAPPAVGRTTRSGHPYVSVLFLAAIGLLLTLVANVNHVVSFANVAALVAMIVVDLAAFRLARQGFPNGMRLPGGVTIPVLALLSCFAQFPSLGWRDVLIGLAFVAAGGLLYASRHHVRFGENVEHELRDAIHRLETPLTRTLRRDHGHRQQHSRHTHPRTHAPGTT
jgi:amino acid transporter